MVHMLNLQQGKDVHILPQQEGKAGRVRGRENSLRNL